jgi:hypothetical protein
MDKKTEKVLSATGAFTRTAMQRGMRRRKSASKPGDYPSAHGNSLLRDRILFGFDVGTESLIVGPDKLDSTDREVAAAGKTVPELINFGGTVTRKAIYDPKTKQIRRIRHNQRPRQWVYRPRPFVALTLPIAAKKLADNMERFELQ